MKRAPHTKSTEKFVAYYRVSTARQGQSGLGLDSQRESVERFIRHNGNRIVAEYTEVESGKKDNRPELMKAVQFAKDNDAMIIVAKLDRLGRSVSFISELMEKKVKFTCADLPMVNHENEFVVHLMAAFAQLERNLIVERVRSAHAAKRRREPDWKEGSPQDFTVEHRKKAIASMKRNADENKENKLAYEFIARRRTIGMSWEEIARALNREGYRTRYDKQFYGQTVKNIYNRFSGTLKKQITNLKDSINS